mgnify:CR=1 FL=1
MGGRGAGAASAETRAGFRSAIAVGTYAPTRMYPDVSRAAREEGFNGIADWFEALAKAEKSHAGRFALGLEAL